MDRSLNPTNKIIAQTHADLMGWKLFDKAPGVPVPYFSAKEGSKKVPKHVPDYLNDADATADVVRLWCDAETIRPDVDISIRDDDWRVVIYIYKNKKPGDISLRTCEIAGAAVKKNKTLSVAFAEAFAIVAGETDELQLT